MYKCIIIDDESHAVDYLKKYLSRIPEFEIVATYTDPTAALTEILLQPPVDLILMDVDMPEISGIELSKAVRKQTDKLVFTTAHSKYGYEAFQVDADAYILKPYNFVKFMSIIHKLFNLDKSNEHNIDSEPYFFVRASKTEDPKIIKIKYNDIIAIESNLNYVMIHTEDSTIETYMSLNDIAQQLESIPDLVRFQRSFIVNKSKIEHIDGNVIKMDNGLRISVGNYYRKSFTEFVSRNLVKAR